MKLFETLERVLYLLDPWYIASHHGSRNYVGGHETLLDFRAGARSLGTWFLIMEVDTMLEDMKLILCLGIE